MDTCQDIFLLYITAETARNLNQLAQEFRENGISDFTFIYNILDTFVRLKSFRIESDNLSLNETIVIRIKTSLPVLMNYLHTKSHFFVRLKSNNKTVAQSEVNLKSLVTTSCLSEFKLLNKNAATTMSHYCVLKNVHVKESNENYKKGIHKTFILIHFTFYIV